MKKYKVLPAPPMPEALEKLLNDQAAAGWEFVGSTAAGLVFESGFVDIVTNSTNMIGFNKDDLTTVQAAALAGCHPNSILYHIKNGKLKGIKKAGRYAVKRADLDAWMKEQNL